MQTTLMTSPIHLAVCFNDAFAEHAAVAVESLLSSTRSKVEVHGLFPVDSSRADLVRKVCERHSAVFHACPVKDGLLDGIRVDGHATAVNYYRILIPSILPESVHRVIYMDCDVVVLKPVETLWSADLKGGGLGAVRNFGDNRPDEQRLGLTGGYFNSGVLVMDLDYWRKNDVAKRVLEDVRKHPEKMVYWDQDAMNRIFDSKWTELPLEWNVQHGVFFNQEIAARYASLQTDPAIVHFSGHRLKPWDPGVKHPFAGEYFKNRSACGLPALPDSRHTMPESTGLIQRLKGGMRRIRDGWIRSDTFWNGFLSSRLSFAVMSRRDLDGAAHAARTQTVEHDHEQRLLQQLFPDLTVRSGPFAGLKYPKGESAGSRLLPKLAGTYEAELGAILEEAFRTSYDVAVNVGCGEGYFAAGLAMRMPDCRVVAYDIDPTARALTVDLAALNGFSGRVEVRSAFSIYELQRMSPIRRG
ncbi:MAG TPA: glycosyltransferase, partial [Roseimicrobium sp.]|nr:glycosyltransferase [Roseimicrobium sp.]